MIRIASRLAQMNGWADDQVTAFRTGIPTSDVKIDALAGLVREAAANSGNVTDAAWKVAQQAGWSDEQLADAFAYVGATVFTGYFLNYAQTEMDVSWNRSRPSMSARALDVVDKIRQCLRASTPTSRLDWTLGVNMELMRARPQNLLSARQ